MNSVEKVLRKNTVNLFNDNWYESTSKEIMGLKDKQKGYVYFLKNGEQSDLIKIGYSVNLNSRLKSLKTGFGDSLFLIGYIYCDNFIDLESEFHKKYNDSRKIGEWFKINEKEIKEIIIKNKGINVNGFLVKDSKIIDGMYFDFSESKDVFLNKAYYEEFFNHIESLKFEKEIQKDIFYKEVRGIKKDYSLLSPKKCNLILKKYCKNKGYKYFDYNKNGKRGFILSK